MSGGCVQGRTIMAFTPVAHASNVRGTGADRNRGHRRLSSPTTLRHPLFRADTFLSDERLDMATSEQSSQSGHARAHSGSAALCDALYSALCKRITGLKRYSNQNYCRFGRPRYAIAYLSHRKKAPRIEVWFRSSADEQRTEGGILIRPRRKEVSVGGFRNFGARFEISDLNQVPAACEIVCRESHLG
jgi:hypothetical protein